MVHSTGHAAVVNAKDWESVVDNDEILLSSGNTLITKMDC